MCHNTTQLSGLVHSTFNVQPFCAFTDVNIVASGRFLIYVFFNEFDLMLLSKLENATIIFNLFSYFRIIFEHIFKHI